MPKIELSYHKVKKRDDGNFFIEFTLGSKRMRLVNGQKIKFNLQPNLYPPNERKSKAELLAKEVYNYLKECGVDSEGIIKSALGALGIATPAKFSLERA